MKVLTDEEQARQARGTMAVGASDGGQEMEQLRAEVERLRALEEQWRLGLGAAWAGCATMRAERDRLRTALAAVVEVSDSESATMDTHFEVLEMARSVLADTARAANLRLTGVVPVLHVRDGGACTCGCPADDGLLAERDRLRAVLAETLSLLSEQIHHAITCPEECAPCEDLAALRARAGLEPTP